VAVYIIEGSEGQPGALRHVDLRCLSVAKAVTYAGLRPRQGSPRPIPFWLSNDESFEVVYVSNTARLKNATDPCPSCLYHGGPITIDWKRLMDALRPPASSGVYDIADRTNRICQIGSGDVRDRVESRLKATCRGRLAPDSIWWLYDMFNEGRSPAIDVLELELNEAPGAAEDRWRDRRRREGWQVSSTR
jgi:hypothetical protein